MDESRNNMREEFESWLAPSWSRDTYLEDEGEVEYVDDWVQGAWVGWRASRAAIEIELPKPHAHLIWIQAGHAPDDYWDDVAVSYSEKDKCCDGSDRYPVHAGWEIEEVLRAAGIKVKE